MDPISVAGLGLGAASLSFQLFAGCIKGFVLLSTAHNLGNDSNTLLCMLNLQEIHLTEWARRAGLLDGGRVLNRQLNENAVQLVLHQLQDLLLNTDKLKHRYKLGLVANSFSPHTEVASGTSPVMRGILGDAISDELRGDIMYRARLIQSKNTFPQRLWWAAVDKSKFSELVDAIRSFVSELWHLYDPIRQDEMCRDLQVVLSHVIKMNSRVDQLLSLQETLQRSSTTSISPSSRVNDSTLASAAEVKLVKLRISAVSHGEESAEKQIKIEQSEAHLQENTPNLTLDIELSSLQDFTKIKGSPQMGTAIYGGETVLVEWKNIPTQSRSKIIARIYDLATLLGTAKHPEFRSLKCRGVAVDTLIAKAAFVFELPHSSMIEASQRSSPPSLQPPQSLRSLFTLTPSVTDRFRLALQITQSVKYFHTAGWLHKDLRSENILFLMSQGSSSLPSSILSRPVLAGFAFSRLNSPSQISEQPSSDPGHDIYRHPEAMGEPSTSFDAIKDIYSLGTILLEIGEWRSLKSLVEKVVDVRKSISTAEIAKVRPYLLDESSQGGLGMLKYRMGNIYTAVTEMMLRGDIPDAFASEKSSHLTFQPDILDIAIRELGQCVI